MMFKVWFVAVLLTVFATIFCSGNVTPAQQCPGESFEGLQDRIQVTPCGKSRCNLVKNTNVTVNMKFTVVDKTDTMTNEVYAYIGGAPVPFLGVDGTDACQHVKRAASDEYVACPLAPGDYEYTNVFPVLPVYPTLSTKVHWSLKAGKKSLICFEVPAAITAGSKH
ncbi:hypothetical protein PYW07_007871 [Mythimna separata]|uniref:MD-2-related lipid-recognition domain-containing protein n=1 Tax=Mythimna separata TaxID=271217 RepID=A0AAD7YRN3_MYTSE|nr:hypothetical protein PYW07_007871 [Mythimna separata]